MSFCPTKDIHSIYLDNELPEIYKAEYEAHINSCEKCKMELEKLRKLHSLFNSDSSQITPDSHYLDQSFERLKIKMDYSKNTTSPVNKFKYFIPSCAAAAVAIFALAISLNTRITAKKDNAMVASATDFVSRNAPANNVSLTGGRSMVISGNIHQSINQQFYPNYPKNYAISDGKGVVISGNIKESLISSGNTRNVNTNNWVRNVEVFGPEINDESKISIKITVPNMDQVPVCTEIEVPINRAVITGQE